MPKHLRDIMDGHGITSDGEAGKTVRDLQRALESGKMSASDAVAKLRGRYLMKLSDSQFREIEKTLRRAGYE